MAQNPTNDTSCGTKRKLEDVSQLPSKRSTYISPEGRHKRMLDIEQGLAPLPSTPQTAKPTRFPSTPESLRDRNKAIDAGLKLRQRLANSPPASPLPSDIRQPAVSTTLSFPKPCIASASRGNPNTTTPLAAAVSDDDNPFTDGPITPHTRRYMAPTVNIQVKLEDMDDTVDAAAEAGGSGIGGDASASTMEDLRRRNHALQQTLARKNAKVKVLEKANAKLNLTMYALNGVIDNHNQRMNE